MKYKIFKLSYFIFFIVVLSCRKDTAPNKNTGIIQIVSVKIGSSTLDVRSNIKNVPDDQPLQIVFTDAVDTTSIVKVITLRDSVGVGVAYTYTASDNLTTLNLIPISVLQYSNDYILAISSSLHGTNGESFAGIQYKFTTLTGSMKIDSISLNGSAMTTTLLQNIDPKKINIKVTFSQSLNPDNYKSSLSFTGPPLTYILSNNNKTILASNSSKAEGLTKYLFTISSSLTSAGGYTFPGFSSVFIQGSIPLISILRFQMMIL